MAESKKQKDEAGQSKLTACFWVRDQFLPATDCTPAQANALMWLATYANPDGSNIRPGNPRIIASSKLSKSELKRAIKFWLQYPSRVLLQESRGNGQGNASVFRIRMFELEGVHHEPLDAEQKGPGGTRLDNEGVREGVHTSTRRGSKRGPGGTPTESPSTESSSSRSESASSSNGSSSGDDDLKFQKAREEFVAKTPGAKDELAEAADLIRDRQRSNGNKPVRNWLAYLRTSFDEFDAADFEHIRHRLATAAREKYLTSPAAKAKASHLVKLAREHNWTDHELTGLLYDFDAKLTAESIAGLTELRYQSLLTRVQQPPESVCRECGVRDCEHLRADRERLLAEGRQRFREMQGRIHE